MWKSSRNEEEICGALLDRKECDGMNLYGKNPVLEALRAKRPINKILVAKGFNKGMLREITNLAKEQKIIIQFVDKKQLDLLCEKHELHQGIIAQTAPKEYADWEDVLNKVKEKGETPLFLLLDEVKDPQNLGAVLRTADATGVHCVVIPKHRAVPLTSGVSKASAGAVEYVPVARVTNLANTIDKLKEMGCWVIGTDVKAELEHFDMDLTGPVALVMGSEDKGLRKLVKEKCDQLVKIPMKGRVNSLNVSAAASVVLYEIIRQRRNM